MILLSALALLSACKPSVENETRKWGHNLSNAQTALAKYPNFGKHATPLVNQAKADWQKALSITDEEKKAEAMKAVNKQFSKGLLGKLTQVIYKDKSINDDLNKLSKKQVPKSILYRIKNKIASARSKQSEAKRLMYAADTSTLESSTKAVEAAISKLIAAGSDVRSAKKLARKKK